jgi:hypothetical protein
MRKLPNFFVVGDAKAGTTSLYYYLKQHPEIYMSPIKEPHFFSKDINVNLFRKHYRKTVSIDTKNYFSKPKLKELPSVFITEYEDYVQLFREVKDEKAIGEASVSYLYSKVAAREIYKFNPNSKIIIILRDPIERAYSHYIMDLRSGFTDEADFIKAVINDYNKLQKGWGISNLYIELGLYYEQVKRYLEVFPKENVKIILYDDYKNQTEKVIKEIFLFLDVDSNFLPDISKKYNSGAVPKYLKFNKMVREIYSEIRSFIPQRILNILREIYANVFWERNYKTISNEERKILLEFFRDDIEKLSNLIEKDLTIWLS